MIAEASAPDPRSRSQAPGAVVRLHAGRSDQEILRAVAAGERWAAAELLERYGSLVERLIRRILGHDPELEDLVHDAFASILSSVHQVRQGESLKGWIGSVAVHTAHHAIRRRRTARWFGLLRAEPEPVVESAVGPRDAVRRVYEALDQLPADERVAFALRYLEEMQLEEVAAACGVSLATTKRRLTRAEKQFVAIAKRDGVLRAWMEEGERWSAD